MAKVHEIGIGADTRAFEDQVKSGVIDPVEDAEKALKKLGETDAGKDASRDVDKLEDALKDAQRESKDLGKKIDDVGDTAKRSMQQAEEGVKDFKEEAQQSAREAAASFDGSLESIAEVGQEIAANAFGGFGPAGVAAGIAVAAGAGVIIDTVGKIGEAFDEAKESAFDMAYGISGALETAGVQSRMAEWSGDTEKWKQVTDLAVASGWDEIDVLTALAKGGDDLDKLTGAFADHGGQTMVTNGRLLELDGVLRGVSDGYMSAAQATEVNARALYDYAQQAGVATGDTDDLGNAIYRLPDETEVAVNAKTKTATQDIERVGDAARNVPDAQINAYVAGTNRVRVDLDALTRTRTVYIRPEVLAAVGGTRSWD